MWSNGTQGPVQELSGVMITELIDLCIFFQYSNTPKAELEQVYFGFLTVMDEVILPSLSLLPANCCMSEEVWGFLKLLRYEHR